MPLTKVTKGVSQGLASLDGNGEVVEKPAGAAAALATDVLRADGTFGASGLGEGQTWQNVIASRNIGVIYTNTTGRSIKIEGYCTSTSGTPFLYLDVGGIRVLSTVIGSIGWTQGFSGIVRNGETYILSGINLVKSAWMELR